MKLMSLDNDTHLYNQQYLEFTSQTTVKASEYFFLYFLYYPLERIGWWLEGVNSILKFQEDTTLKKLVRQLGDPNKHHSSLVSQEHPYTTLGAKLATKKAKQASSYIIPVIKVNNKLHTRAPKILELSYSTNQATQGKQLHKLRITQSKEHKCSDANQRTEVDTMIFLLRFGCLPTTYSLLRWV